MRRTQVFPLVLAALSVVACSSVSHPTARITATPPHLQLKRGSDQDILRQIGFDASKMKAHVVQGPDGYETDYDAPNREWVSIVRSASTGVYVRYGDTTGEKGSWELGFR